MSAQPTDDYAELLRRIEARREAVGGISETQVCLRAGLTKDAIRTIRRGNAPRAETLKALAGVLGCPSGYFLEAVGMATEIGADDAPPQFEEDVEAERGEEIFAPGYVNVRTLADRVGMGGASFGGADDFGSPELMPERLIRVDLRGEPMNFLLVDVDGPSMSPILESGDRVMIDLRKTNPAQPGIFVVNEGLGYVAKWVQLMPHSDPPKLKIKSENPRFDPYDVLLDQARIIGRIVWFARRL